MNQVVSFVDIMQENFGYDELFINIPIAILDFNDLISQNCRPKSPASVEDIDLTTFDFQKFSKKIKVYFDEEKQFYVSLSDALMKIMQK